MSRTLHCCFIFYNICYYFYSFVEAILKILLVVQKIEILIICAYRLYTNDICNYTMHNNDTCDDKLISSDVEINKFATPNINDALDILTDDYISRMIKLLYEPTLNIAPSIKSNMSNKIELPIAKTHKLKPDRIITSSTILPTILSKNDYKYVHPDFIIEKLSCLSIIEIANGTFDISTLSDIIYYVCPNSVIAKIIGPEDQYQKFVDDYTDVFNFIKKFDSDGNILDKHDKSMITNELINKLINVYTETITDNNIDEVMKKIIMIKYHSHKNMDAISAEINASTFNIRKVITYYHVTRKYKYKYKYKYGFVVPLVREEIPYLFFEYDVALLLLNASRSYFSMIKNKHFTDENVYAYTFLKKKMYAIINRNLYRL